jgi:hypothetical protein
VVKSCLRVSSSRLSTLRQMLCNQAPRAASARNDTKIGGAAGCLEVKQQSPAGALYVRHSLQATLTSTVPRNLSQPLVRTMCRTDRRDGDQNERVTKWHSSPGASGSGAVALRQLSAQKAGEVRSWRDRREEVNRPCKPQCHGRTPNRMTSWQFPAETRLGCPR